jgi:hypothetical protein
MLTFVIKILKRKIGKISENIEWVLKSKISNG